MAQRIHGRAPRSGSKLDPIALDLTRLEINPTRTRYIAPHIVQIFGRKSRTRRTLGSHQIWVFRCQSEQLVSREARRELKEALAHVLGTEASSEATITIDKHRPSCLTIAGLHCCSPPIKVSINMFPSLLWFHSSIPHKKPTTVARENSNSGEPPRSAATRRCEHEPAPPQAGFSRLSRWIGDEWPRLEAEIPIRLIQSEPSIRKPMAGV
jgi:hypothetical protein